MTAVLSVRETGPAGCPPRRGLWRFVSPGNLVLLLGLWELFLLVSQQGGWFWFNRAKGIASLLAAGSLAAVIMLLGLWFGLSLLARVPFQFSWRALLGFVCICSIPCAWVSNSIRQSHLQAREATAWETIILTQIESKSAGLELAFLPQSVKEFLGPWYFSDGVEVSSTVDVQPGSQRIRDLTLLPAFPKLQRLSLNGFTLTRDGIARLKQQRELRSLSLCGSENKGEDWNFLGSLDNLERLSLESSDCGDETLNKIERFARLRKLNIASTNVTTAGLKVLTTLPNLEELTVSAEQFTDIGLSHLAACPRLTTLTIDGYFVGSPSMGNLSRLQSLRELTVERLQLPKSTLDQIGRMTSLRVLRLIQCQGMSDADLASLEGLSQLQELALDESKITDNGLTSVVKLTDLKRLSLYGTRINDDGIAKLLPLSELHTLDLTFTNVGDRGLQVLEKLAGLRELDVSGTQVTAAGEARFQAANPNCRVSRIMRCGGSRSAMPGPAR